MDNSLLALLPQLEAFRAGLAPADLPFYDDLLQRVAGYQTAIQSAGSGQSLRDILLVLLMEESKEIRRLQEVLDERDRQSE